MLAPAPPTTWTLPPGAASTPAPSPPVPQQGRVSSARAHARLPCRRMRDRAVRVPGVLCRAPVPLPHRSRQQRRRIEGPMCVLTGRGHLCLQEQPSRRPPAPRRHPPRAVRLRTASSSEARWRGTMARLVAGSRVRRGTVVWVSRRARASRERGGGYERDQIKNKPTRSVSRRRRERARESGSGDIQSKVGARGVHRGIDRAGAVS